MKIYKSNSFFKNSLLLIFIVSFGYALIINGGYFGYGIDYYNSYSLGPQKTSNIWDTIGWTISTLEIFEYKIGLFLVSFFLSVSSGLLIRLYFKNLFLYSIILFLIIHILAIFSWPIIVSTSNAMRQGLAMCFIFISLISFFNNNKNLGLIFIIIATFTHKSGIFFVINTFYTYWSISFYKYICKKKKIRDINSFFALSGFCYFILITMIIYTLQVIPELRLSVTIVESNISIAKDFRIPLLFISLIFIIFFILKLKFSLNNYINYFIFYFSCSSAAVFLVGLNWQYERLMMMMIIPYILAIGLFFTKKSVYVYYLIIFFSLFILTLLTGMYTLGVGVFL
jgi:hypothetical protein